VRPCDGHVLLMQPVVHVTTSRDSSLDCLAVSTGASEVGWLVCLFNGTSTQKGQFVPTAREGNRLKSAKYGQRDTMHITCYTITM